MSQSEDLEQQRPLLPKPPSISFSNRPSGHVSRALESDKCHKFVIFLVRILLCELQRSVLISSPNQIAVDASCILADLTYTFLSEECIPAEGPEAPHWLLILALISLSITTLFLIEIPLALYAFGVRYYVPFGGYPLAGLHLFDALVIVTTFIFEFALKGRERELAGLLIMLRLWRLVKLVGGKEKTISFLYRPSDCTTRYRRGRRRAQRRDRTAARRYRR
jgi:hypothetical protein